MRKKNAMVNGSVLKGLTMLAMLLIFVAFCGNVSTNAADKATIVGTVVQDDRVDVYAKGFAATDDFAVLLGNREVKTGNITTIADSRIPMKTLLLLDNSADTKSDSRKMFNSFMETFIAAKSNYEEVSIAAFGDTVSTVIDYSDDYIALINAFKGISYVQKKTLLTDVIYNIVDQNAENDENSYRRIILLTDGMEDESIGYTKEELYKHLEKNPIPIYVLGSKTRSNSSQLETAFALSRKSGATSYILNDYNNMLDIAEELKADENIVRVSVLLNDDMLDGSEKTLKLSNGTSFATVDIRMPQTASAGSSVSDTPAPADTSADVVAPASDPLTVADDIMAIDIEDEISIDGDDMITIDGDDDSAAEEGKKKSRSIFDEEPEEDEDKSFFDSVVDVFKEYWLYFAIGGGVLLILIIVLIVVHASKKSKKKSEEVPYVPAAQMPMPDLGNDPMDQTVKINFAPDIDSDDGTVRLWDNKSAYVSLKDVNKPGMEFRQLINGTVTIGRSSSKNMIVINYDKSVSGQHCTITLRDGVFYILDSGSSNGTFVNNERIVGEKALTNGDYINIGQTTLVFEGTWA